MCIRDSIKLETLFHSLELLVLLPRETLQLELAFFAMTTCSAPPRHICAHSLGADEVHGREGVDPRLQRPPGELWPAVTFSNAASNQVSSSKLALQQDKSS